jgi:ABC-type glycerol-3-phosphate transport system substrate-binding protein
MGERREDDPEVSRVLDQALHLYCGGEPEPNCESHSYFNTDLNDITWDQGVRKILDKEAMMAPMGDWAKGFLEAEGLVPGRHFDVVPFPGTAEIFVFTSDTFPLPRGAPNREGALELLKTFASLDGQIAFNRLKGSIPSRMDAAPDLFDVVARRTMSDFHEATKVLALSGLLANDEMADLAPELKASMRRGSVEIITNYIRANYKSIAEQ